MSNGDINRDNNQYSLSIRFGSDGFSLSVHDEMNCLLSTKKVTFPLFTHNKEEIVHKLLHEPELQVSCTNFRLICELSTYAFVPSTIFAKEHADSFLFHHDSNNKDETTIFNYLDDWGMVNVFSIPLALYSALRHLYPDLKIEHHLTNFFTSKVDNTVCNTIQIWVRASEMDVIVFKNSQPILINTFQYKSTEDFVYYTMNLFEQLSLSTETYNVKLFNTNKSTDLKNNLQRFVKSVKCY